MKHISQIGLVKKTPKLNKYQAEEVWRLTKDLLPYDCPLKNGETIAYEVLSLISYFYLKREPVTTAKICSQCTQEADNEFSSLPYLSRAFCPHRANHFH